jgi:hypothetical protein
MKPALVFLLLLTALPPGWCAGRFSADSREFGKRKGGYKVRVDYAQQGGAGPARFTLMDVSGRTVSVFEEARAPVSVTVSGDGSRLIAFNGWWGQTVAVTNMCVYASDGKLLGKYKLSAGDPAGEDFSSNFGVYAAGMNRDKGGTIYALSTSDGKLLLDKAFSEKLNGFKLSGDGRRLLLVFLAGEGKYRVALLDLSGRQYWERTFSTSNNVFPHAVNRDGSEFELWEDRAVYKRSDGYYHDTVLLKRTFKAGTGGIGEIKTEKVREEVR